MSEPRFLTPDEVLALHAEQLRLFGGASGVRDPGLMQSAIGGATATFDGVLLHETLFAMAAAYLYGICRNHPFLDGNKRTAVATALTFLALNGIEVVAAEDPFYELVIGVAEGCVDRKMVSRFLEEHATS